MEDFFITVSCPYKTEIKNKCKLFGKECSFYPKCNHKLNCSIVYKSENKTCNGKNL